MAVLETILGVGSLLSGLFGGGSNAQKSETTNETITSNKQGQQYSDAILTQLENLLGNVLGGDWFSTAQSGLSGRLEQVQTQAARPAFDVDAFVNDTMQRASSAAQFDLESGLNKLFSATGTSEGDNSMTALLSNRLRTDTAANMAGIAAQARSTGEQILSQQQQGLTSEVSTLSNSMVNQILGLLDVGKGANVSSTETQTKQSQTSGTAQENKSLMDRINGVLGTLQQSAQNA